MSTAYQQAYALLQAGRLAEAELLGRQLLQVQPAHGPSWQLLGIIAFQQGRLDQAIEMLHKAIDSGLGTAEVFNNLGAVYQAAGRLEDAIKYCRRGLELDPHHADALRNLAFFLHRQGNHEEAEAKCRLAIQLNPKNSAAYNTLGNILQDQSRFDEAIASYRTAVEIAPRDVKAVGNMGNALTFSGRFDEALEWYERSLTIQPDYSDAHLHRAIIWLLHGDFRRGWPEYEWRFRNRQFVNRQFTAPRWEGQNLPHATILAHGEQGLGDTIQFVRYAPWIKERVGRVLVACPTALCKLLASCPGVDGLVPFDAPLPPIDVHIPLLSVPGLANSDEESIPRQVPYIFAEPARVDVWKGKLSHLAGARIGIAWQGNPTHAKDARRSIALRHFAPLAQVPGVTLISLQKNVGTQQLAKARFPVSVLDESVDEGGAFVDTSAIMHNLDLVITSDTSIAHLAGALAVPVWVALPVVPDWRWLLKRSDSPWYPTMRLFRQQDWGDWDAVFGCMAEELSKFVLSKSKI